MLTRPDFASVAANANSRTLRYTLYDLTDRTVEVDFYLDSQLSESHEFHEERSQVFRFAVTPRPLSGH